MEFALLFGILPIISIALLFVKDTNRPRKLILNILLLLNAFVFLVPMLAAYLSTAEGESMFNENTGGGAYLWFYMFLLPLCGLALLVLGILKVVFALSSKK